MTFQDFNIKKMFEDELNKDERSSNVFEDTLHITWQDDVFIPAGNNEAFVRRVSEVLYSIRNTEIGIGYHDLEYILNRNRREIGKWFTNEPTINRLIEEVIYSLKKREMTDQIRTRYKVLLIPFMNEEFVCERFERIYRGSLSDDDKRTLCLEFLWDSDLML